MLIADKDLGYRGTQRLYRFDNGYGASVVRGPGTYGGGSGLWELAVIKWYGEEWDLCYDTPITDEVLGWNTEDDIADLLDRIELL
jgi:hypothetical protein